MPELPEVETTVRGLRRTVVGRKIKAIDSDWPKLIRNTTLTKLRKAVVGKSVESVTRRGKNILMHLSNDKTLRIHMKMTGHMMYGEYKKVGKSWKPKDPESPLADPYNRFIHLVFKLDSDKCLVLSDARKFARIELHDTDKLNEAQGLKELGPDMLGRFSWQEFKKQIQKKPKGKIKQVLLDQTTVAGIGNIYSDELLWYSGIHPESQVSRLTDGDYKKMYKSARDLLQKGVKLKGDSTSDYRDIDGKPGKFQKLHVAYRKTGEWCAKRGCKGKISRIKMGGRSAHFCKSHQACKK